jgi:hypothetical protein
MAKDIPKAVLIVKGNIVFSRDEKMAHTSLVKLHVCGRGTK